MLETAITGGESGKPALVPGKPDESELFRRIAAEDADDVMPPPKSKKSLTTEQIETIRKCLSKDSTETAEIGSSDTVFQVTCEETG